MTHTPNQTKRAFTLCLLWIVLLLQPAPGAGAPQTAGKAADCLDINSTKPAGPVPRMLPAEDDEYSRWRLDVNSGCSFSDYDFNLVVDAKPADITDLTLTITAYDVDYTDPNDACSYGPEVDKVYINGHELGRLTGANDSWSTNTFVVNSSWINGATDTAPNGTNAIHILVDAGGDYCWCVGIGWIELKGKVGFQVTNYTPENNSENIDWETPGISVTFDSAYKPESLDEDTFDVFYWNSSNQKEYVDGTIESSNNGKTATFTPSGPLMDGVFYVVEVWGKKDAEAANRSKWVLGSGGAILQRGKAWSFWTMPDLAGKVTVVPVQSVENVNFIANKPTVVKVFLRWDKKSNVAENWQLKKIDTDVKVIWTGDCTSGNSEWSPYTAWTPAYGTKLKREYEEFTKADESYTKLEKLRAQDSVNYYGCTPCGDSISFTAEVTPKNQKKNPPRKFTSEAVSKTVISTKQFTYRVLPVNVGDWAATGVLSGANVNIQGNMDGNHATLLAMYPLSAANTTRVTAAPLSAIPLVNPPDQASYSTTGTSDDFIRLLGWLSREAEAANIDAHVGVVPLPWLGSLGLTYTETWFGIDYARHSALVINSASEYILSHEFGHMLRDWDDYDQILEADEGFNTDARDDKRNTVAKLGGFPESGAIYHFMARDAVASLEHDLWIDEPQFTELYNNELAAKSSLLESPTDTPLLVASGKITVATNAVTPDPWYVIPDGKWKQPGASDYGIVFLNGSGQTLSNYGLPVSQAVSGKAYFLVKVPYPAGTARVRLTHGAVVMLEVTASANAPQLNITAPTAGTTWSGTQTITWTASDLDGNPLHYLVQTSIDNGATWQPLAMDLIATSCPLNTLTLGTGPNRHVRVMATDGLNTTVRTAGPFTVTNAPWVVSTLPATGATGVAQTALIRAVFSEAVNATTLTAASFYVRDNQSNKVSGTIAYDTANLTATFTPAALLKPATTYTAVLTTAVAGASGTSLASEYAWSFTTGADVGGPEIVMVSPPNAAINVPVNSSVAAVFDEAINPATLTTSSFVLRNAAGQAVAGTVTWYANSSIARFQPSANLTANAMYTATLTEAITDGAGNPMSGDYGWSFSTGSSVATGPQFTGSFRDWGADDNGDGLFDRLIIEVGLEIRSNAYYNLNGKLKDAAGAEIEWATSGNISLDVGMQTVQLVFTGKTIHSHGVDGPYVLTELHVYEAWNTSVYAWMSEAWRTQSYDVDQFYGVLRFSGLPDVTLAPGQTQNQAFNLNEYASHATLPDDQLTYSIESNTDNRCGVTIDGSDWVNINPEAGWLGFSDVTLQVTGGGETALDTFRVTVEPCTAPSITTHPQSTTIAAGQTATLSVVATGSAPLGYLWYQGASPSTATPAPGTNNQSTYTTPALTVTTGYWVRVTNACNHADSNTATVTVGAGQGPAITAQPPSKAMLLGRTTTLSVTATGSAPLNYQWYYGVTGDTSNPVSPGNISSITTQAVTNTTNYWVRVSNGYGSVNSNTATVYVIKLAIPAAAHTPGASGTYWLTDVDLYNSGTSDAGVRVFLFKANQTNLSPQSTVVTVPAGQSLQLLDVLGTTFSATNAGLGFFTTGAVAVNSRFFNTASACGGTFGMYIPAQAPSQTLPSGSVGMFHFLRYSTNGATGFRTNIGFLNGSGFDVQVEIRLLGDNGQQIGNSLYYTLKPFEHYQYTKIHEWVSSGNVTNGAAEVRVLTAGGEVFAYAMVIDNVSGDPVFKALVVR